ncbi:sigma-70 family RNA polymerase sigma factor [Pedobacter sp. B4-66]|uniref:RNA polymerase sigma factor n=1 Tax=Pedobacter sp. B4-66 TaxID=2817280 RepID=UPI001BDA180A|nr:sigma-70 family RNA polymerase sigma factor [Pedobacter sp. B4-66]
MKDLKSFEYIYIQHWEKLYAFCFKMTCDDYVSQNIVQDIFTDLWGRRDKVQILSIENYLFRAAKNQVLKEYRKKRFDTVVLEEKFENYLVENTPSLEPELLAKLYSLLEHLPEKRKEILIMNKLEEMDIAQIAAKLNLSKQTVKNQVSSALKQLRLHAGETFLLIFALGIYLAAYLNDILTII